MIIHAFLVAAACLLPVIGAVPRSVPVRDFPDSTTSGQIEISAPPHEVYQRLTDYTRWSPMFSDITSATLESGGRDDATLRFTSKTFRHALRVRFANSPGQSIQYTVLEGQPPNVQIDQKWLLTPLAEGSRTLVEERVHMEVRGLFSIYFTPAKVKDMREQKVQTDLQDLAANFR